MGPRTWSARRLASAAIAFGALAVVTLFLASAGTSSDAGGDDDGWVLGLLLVFGPVIAAGTTRSVAASVLLRPVGAVAAVVAALTSAVHVGVAVDDRGAAGWLYGAPAVVVTGLVVAAVAAGRDVPRPRVGPPAESPAPRRSEDDVAVEGPPLDVLGPLRRARGHAAKSLLAWLLVLVVSLVATPPALRLLGWPTVEATVEAEVVDVVPSGDGVMVSFAATHDGVPLRWEDESPSTGWDVGDRRTVHLADDGKVHFDRQLGLAGAPLLFPIAFVGLFGAFALRRAWGLVVAVVDASRSGDEPRLGYVATLVPPRQWRPLAAVWWQDPTGVDRLARPDAVYRIDDETGQELESSLRRVTVHRAWVDTGPWPGAKPRWIGADRGVVVPHRRAVLGRWLFRALSRRTEVAPVVPLRHSAPASATLVAGDEATHHSLAPMVAWRLLAVPVALVAALVSGPGGEAVRRLG